MIAQLLEMMLRRYPWLAVVWIFCFAADCGLAWFLTKRPGRKK